MIKTQDPVYIIAEAGVNHNGDLDLAKQLIDTAKEAGADAVKFQAFTAEAIVSKQAPTADYQRRNIESDCSQYDMLKSLELSYDKFHILFDYCREQGIEFLCTASDTTSLELLQNIGVNKLKLSSGDLNNAPFMMAVGKTGLPVILSSGMSTLSDIELALGILCHAYANETTKSYAAFIDAYIHHSHLLTDQVALLHCTSDYPAAPEAINLRAMQTLTSFGLPTGYSDHSMGTAISVAAVAQGARIIEKHFTLDKTMAGPDHKASLDPNELKELVSSIREVEAAMGSTKKIPTISELSTRDIARKSLVTEHAIKAGEVFTEHNVSVKRPGTGIASVYYWDIIGKTAHKDFNADELITLD